MTKLIATFRNFENAPRKVHQLDTVRFGMQRHAYTFVVCKAAGRKSSERRRYRWVINIEMNVTLTMHEDLGSNPLACVMVQW
jgi:hypothetical protein